MNILVSGASGLIGTALIPALEREGHSVARLVRGAPRNSSEIEWTPGKSLDPSAVAHFDAVIHLAARNIGVRWTDKIKREVVASRVEGTRTIAEAVAAAFQLSGKPTTLISATAVGYYGSRGDEILTEESRAGHGFLADTARQWEAATQPAVDAGVRVVLPRISMVVSTEGGGLKSMLPAFRLGLGGPIGSGHQWMSWISIDDVIGGLLFALSNSGVSGPINFTAPEPLTNAEFGKKLGKAVHRPAVFPLPAFAVRLLFGEMGEEILLSSVRAVPGKLEALGFTFKHRDLSAALADVLRKRTSQLGSTRLPT
jgi:uncharacterized protein